MNLKQRLQYATKAIKLALNPRTKKMLFIYEDTRVQKSKFYGEEDEASDLYVTTMIRSIGENAENLDALNHLSRNLLEQIALCWRINHNSDEEKIGYTAEPYKFVSDLAPKTTYNCHADDVNQNES